MHDALEFHSVYRRADAEYSTRRDLHSGSLDRPLLS